MQRVFDAPLPPRAGERIDAFAVALEARVQWALYRVAVVAAGTTTDESDAFATRAFELVERHARFSASVDTVPPMIADVEELVEAWRAEATRICNVHSELRTHEGIKRWLEGLWQQAIRGSGLVYELCVQRFSASVDRNLDRIEEPYQEIAIEIARDLGYLDAEEVEVMRDQLAADGCCSHGLDPDCCPCGCGDIEY